MVSVADLGGRARVVGILLGHLAGIHSAWIGVTLGLAVLLTVLSMGDYLWRYRAVVGGTE